jgi:uncharacterized protein YjbI with pentapeptide repeats
VLTYGTADPTVAANQFVVSSVQSLAGPVQPSKSDGITVPHSFEIPTPTSMQTAIVWLQSGLISGDLTFTPNNIVPGITPMWPITFGSTTGTTDASSVMAATIAASMLVVNGLFGVAPNGITNALLGSGAVATINIQNLAVTNPLLASLCVEATNMAANSVTAGNSAIAALAVVAANLANSSVTATAIANAAVGTAAIANLAVGTAAIQTGAITNALIANLAVSGAQIQLATITGANIGTATIAGANIGTATISQTNMANASIGTAQIINASITNALINDVSASKITAGTITAVTITTATINGGAITGTTLSLTCTISGASVTTAIQTGAILSNYAGLSVTGPSGVAAVVANNSTSGFYAADSSGNIQIGLSYASGGAPGLTLQHWSGGSVDAVTQLATNLFKMDSLPSSNPGTGTKQFWYDPSDGDRVKYAP